MTVFNFSICFYGFGRVILTDGREMEEKFHRYTKLLESFNGADY